MKDIEQVMAVCRLSCLPSGINLVAAVIVMWRLLGLWGIENWVQEFWLSHASGEMHNCVYICHPRSNGNYFSLGSHKCVNRRNGVCAFDRIWHVLVNITIRWGCMYRNAHAFVVQTLCWQPCLEMEIDKVVQCLYVIITVLSRMHAVAMRSCMKQWVLMA